MSWVEFDDEGDDWQFAGPPPVWEYDMNYDDGNWQFRVFHAYDYRNELRDRGYRFVRPGFEITKPYRGERLHGGRVGKWDELIAPPQPARLTPAWTLSLLRRDDEDRFLAEIGWMLWMGWQCSRITFTHTAVGPEAGYNYSTWSYRAPQATEAARWLLHAQPGDRPPSDSPTLVPANPVLPAQFDGIAWDWWMRQQIWLACERIRSALTARAVPYVAFSGGKDSTAVSALVAAVDPLITNIYSDDELEYPQSVDYISETEARLQTQMRIVTGRAQHAGWFTPWADRPFWREPHPRTEDIPSLMEPWAQAEGYNLTFLGLRGAESRGRASHLARAGYLYRTRFSTVCNPIADWSHEDVWAFIHGAAIPYNRAYDRFAELGLKPELQRVGPLPLAPANTLERGWPDLYQRLTARYGNRWAYDDDSPYYGPRQEV